jgi:hypothetical protein
MKNLVSAAFASVVASVLSAGAHGALVTQWTFDSDTTTASTGTGVASLIGGTTASFATGNGGGRGWNTATYKAQGTGSGQAGVQFLVDTSSPEGGFGGIQVTFDQRASGTASRWAQVDYTLDGGATWVVGFWNNAGGLSPHDTFYNFTVDFSSVAGAANNAGFGFRIVSIFSQLAFDQNSTLAEFAANTAYMRANAAAVYSPNTSTATGDYGVSGTWRFDNVTVNGTAIPTPSVLALLGAAGLVARRRR